MKIHFFKYQATGNDFVLIDNRSGKYSFDAEQIKKICHRRLGVGADGLMLIENHPVANFHLHYYNSDGSQSLCGNGSRAAVSLAASLGLVNGNARFEAYDGIHDAEINRAGTVRLRMNNVNEVRKIDGDYFIDTGSPHYLRFVNGLQTYPVVEVGREIRHSDAFAPGGTNVNFVEIGVENSIFVRTFERGVEDETLSCGTGVTAAALASTFYGLTSPVSVKTLGGDLQVEFSVPDRGQHADVGGQADMFHDIYLIGPAKLVFEGDLDL